ncbi:glycosyltransferase family 2 protein [Pelagibacterium lacus]|uniref:Glycosyl transferase n=1 Tax=Pelagibacterium lacus TaxID=2282655 RepID=A0A369W3A8_9HYPH|nr:glycosyltransferase family 2 protein [Pelagibacterium lacus]RDE09164.1 glycosyl transferase [Pelagibacterium lacus]
MDVASLSEMLVIGFAIIQIGYCATLSVTLYLRSLPVDWVDESERVPDEEVPFIVLFYPVLREAEETMRTTFLTIERLDYPKNKYRVVAIPNADDLETVASLLRLKQRFDFLQVLQVPPTGDDSWEVVWNAWDATDKAYWWHRGARAGEKALPPKKTRQLVYAFYTINEALSELPDFLVDYIDADSCPPPDHFRAAAAGIRQFDVLQAQNIAGNCLDGWAASMHSFDHMAWDGYLYPHLSANGRQPFWVLGKGLFFKASDLVALGGFNPWMTIEDPEVGMRFWANGKRIGIIASPLVEEVPATFSHGITQRKRWVAGFFQSLSTVPLTEMGMNGWQRARARLNFVPCLSLCLNPIGIVLGVYVSIQFALGQSPVPAPLAVLGLVNIAVFLVVIAMVYRSTWRRAAQILPNPLLRALYLIRVNPLFLMAWWTLWCVPLWIGLMMYLRDGGLTWERTIKNDANHVLVRKRLAQTGAAGADIIAFPAPQPAIEKRKEISNG